MSLFIDTFKISNPFLLSKKLCDLIENNHVINHIKLYNSEDVKDSFEDNKKTPTQNFVIRAQFKKIYGKPIYEIIYFNSYGKVKSNDIFKSKLSFKKAFTNYARGKLYPYRHRTFEKSCQFDNLLTYHKQKVSKKITSTKFISNEKDLKLEVYKWLLKDKDNIIIPEYAIENRRADYISFNKDKIDCTIVEIKSELDNFDRLEAQLEVYSKVANKVYLAIDINKYNKLIKTKIKIPNHVGIFIYDNSQKKKLKLMKRCTTIKQTNTPFIQFLSYSNINNAFSGFKYSSKLSKTQKEIFLKESIDKELFNRFAYDVISNRHIVESDIRKKHYDNNDLNSAIASAKELKINRFDLNGKDKIDFNKYIADKNILYNYFINRENEFLKIFKEILDFPKYLKNNSKELTDLVNFINNSKDKNSYIHGISNSHIFNGAKYLIIEDKLTFFDTIIKNKKLVFDFF